jgi:predicted transcriptional regulator
MTTIELKERIIEKVNAIDDDSILEEVHQLLQFESTMLYQLTTPEVKAIEEGLDDIKHGRVYTSEQANQQLQEWRKK